MKELMLIDSGMVTEVSNGDFFGKNFENWSPFKVKVSLPFEILSNS